MIRYIFPFRCIFCGIKVESLGLCQKCWVHMEFITTPLCDMCGDPLVCSTESMLCAFCFSVRPPMSHRTVWRYNTYVKQLIFRFKYSKQIWLTEFFGYQMLRILLKYFPETTLLVPVPLHPKRLAERGFNQSLLLARWLSYRTGVPIDYTTLVRIKHTHSQGVKTATERKINVHDAFACRDLLHGKNILLIDDVYTTGATLEACAYTVHHAGAKNIGSITLSKVVLAPHQQWIDLEDEAKAS